MKIQTKPYGEIEVSEKQRLFFPDGIIGFEDIKYYFMLDSREGPYYWLQAEGYPELAFIIMNPRLFKDDYKLMVREEDLKSIDINSRDEMLDFVILTVPEDLTKISANLMGPIIINRKTRKAKQVISENDEYTVKHYIIDEIKGKKKKLVESR
jgi:flagellar assembly factor FliW